MNHDEHLYALKQKEKHCLEKYQKIADKITKERKKGIKLLNEAVTNRMQDLSFAGGSFSVQLHDLNQGAQPYGQESVSTLPTQVNHFNQ